MCVKKNGDGKWKFDQSTAIQTIIIIVVFVATTIAAHYKTVNKIDLSIQALDHRSDNQEARIDKLESSDEDFETRLRTTESTLTFHLGQDKGNNGN